MVLSGDMPIETLDALLTEPGLERLDQRSPDAQPSRACFNINISQKAAGLLIENIGHQISDHRQRIANHAPIQFCHENAGMTIFQAVEQAAHVALLTTRRWTREGGIERLMVGHQRQPQFANRIAIINIRRANYNFSHNHPTPSAAPCARQNACPTDERGGA